MVDASPCQRAALHYARTFGWKLFPARMEAGKKFSWMSAARAPGGENWGMTSDPDQLNINFGDLKWHMTCGVGIPTGAVNQIFVVEVDTKKGHGVDGLASLVELEAKHGRLPDTLMSGSPTGSIHRFFNHPGADIKVRSSASVLGPGIDVKGDGGMVVAPPSKREDGEYRWLNDLPITDAPAWLLALVTEKAQPAPKANGFDPFMASGQRAIRPQVNNEELVSAIHAIPNDDTIDRDQWVRVGMAIWSSTDGEGFEAFDSWSQTWSTGGYDAAKTEAVWDSFSRRPPTNIGAGTLFYLADQATPGWRKTNVQQIKPGPKPSGNGIERPDTDEAPAIPLLRSFFAEELERRPRVDLEWLVRGFVLARALNGLFGDGGVGKDYLLLQLAIAMSCGQKWLGMDVKQGKVLYFPVEDDEDELKRRQYAINKSYGIRAFDHPTTFKIVPMLGEDTVLAVYDNASGVVKPTLLYTAVCDMIDDFQPDLVIVGNRVNIFSVGQNDDAQARQCLQLLNRISVKYRTGIIMPSHVSVRGANTGEGTSGSVQWNNGIRLRTYLSYPKEDKDDPNPETNIRELEVKKSNYTAKGEVLRLQWVNNDDGRGGTFKRVLLAIEEEKPKENETEEQKKIRLLRARDDKADSEFLRLLDMHTVLHSNCSSTPTARSYAPTLFANEPSSSFRGKEGSIIYRYAMNRLLASGRIINVPYGYKSRDTHRLERVRGNDGGGGNNVIRFDKNKLSKGD